MSSAGDPARRTAQRAKHSESVEWLGRARLLAEGVLYGIVGLVAIQIPLGYEPGPLGLVAAGLLAYAHLCGVQARYREV
jgi:hypothetical protein